MELAKALDKEMAKSIGIKLMLARDNAGLKKINFLSMYYSILEIKE